MRVALVSLNARAGDAIGRQLVEKVAALTDHGAAVQVIVTDNRNLHPALRPFTIKWNNGTTTNRAWNALNDADLVIVEYTQFHPILEWLPLLADGKRRIVLDYHGLTPPELAIPNQRADLLRGQEWLGLAQLADLVITHSRSAQSELRDHVDLPANRIVRMAYPVTTPLYPVPAACRLRQQLNLNNARILLFVGRAAPNKRLPILVQAVAELKNDSPAVHAVIVGPSGESYESERTRCRELAADLGVGGRIHWMGCVDEPNLVDCYQSADALVIPSRHEGFCLPVIEAMTYGLPVIVARSTALPETVADAGLLFEPDDVNGLVSQVRRLFGSPSPGFAGEGLGVREYPPSDSNKTSNPRPQLFDVGPHPRPLSRKAGRGEKRRIAVVTPRFGETTGGAERSLTLIARQLAAAGVDVEVFTTQLDCQTNEPFLIHEFEYLPVDSERLQSTVIGITDRPESTTSETEAAYWQNTLRSPDLVAALEDGSFEAVIVGPYLTGLTRDVIRAVGRRAILAPCLHGEPIARLPGVFQMFLQTGGVLYHSAAERELSHVTLELSHHNNTVIGTIIDMTRRGNADRGRRLAGAKQYFLYCGRLIREKNVPELIDRARHLAASRPDCRFVFIGEGNVPIPNGPWSVNLGKVSEADKRDLLAGATALITLSENESLSLAVLEANSQGVPVVVPATCTAMAEHVVQGGGGLLLRRESDFARCLDRLLDHPQLVAELGRRGRDYVQQHYASSVPFVERLNVVLDRMNQPQRDVLIENGRRRAAEFSRDRWRGEFTRVLDQSESNAIELREPVIDIAATENEIAVSFGEPWSLILTHLGGRPIVPTGPARSEIVLRLRSEDRDLDPSEWSIPIRHFLTVGHTQRLSTNAPIVVEAGTYVVEAGLRTHGFGGSNDFAKVEWHGVVATLHIADAIEHQHMFIRPTALVRQLDRIRSVADLPNGYVDVTTGWGARIKHWIKTKLLHNFRVGYVDVLAHQQSRFNRQVIEAVEQLAEPPADDSVDLQTELDRSRQSIQELAARVGRLEKARRRRTKVR